MPMHDFGRLEVYRESIDWVASVYRFTDSLPDSERWGLANQLRRCAASVPANIAEGAGRGTDGEFARFLRIAVGSACEFESHIDVALACGLTEEVSVSEIRAVASRLRFRIHALERRVSGRRRHRSTEY